ncbi:MAG: hypothetical protein Q4Q23_06180 [Methanobacteriaceae archaeon]|nr:hypothetical protein [Methanobacteriaceae archaeon]
MTGTTIECNIIDTKYQRADFELLMKIQYTPKGIKSFIWDGLSWSNSKIGFNRVYEKINLQNEYDEFIKRLQDLINTNLLYEIIPKLNEGNDYFFEKHRIEIIINSIENEE